MKQLNPALKSLFLTRLLLLSFLVSAVTLAHAQCPTPFPGADQVATFRNTPVSTVVTANDATSFSNPTPMTPASLTVSTAPTHGTAVAINDSTIIYTPQTGYTGIDFYSYRVCNTCGGCSQGQVTVSVSAFCPAPAAGNDRYTLYNDRPQTFAVTANDTNVVGGPLTVSILRQPLHGTATVSGTSISFQGNGVYAGADTIAYLICDTCPTSGCDTAYVYLTLVACTRADAVTDRATLVQATSTSVPLLQNDNNVTGFGTVTVTLLNGSHLGGTVGLSGSTLSYTASYSLSGLDTIRYRVCTDCGCDTGLAIFTVTPAPCTRPTALADNEYAGYSITCSEAYDPLANDILPPGGGNAVVSIVTGPGFGTASVSGNRVVYTCTDSTRIGQVDAIRYSVCNSCLCDTGIIAIHITSYICNGLNPIVNKDTAYVCNNYAVNINATANDVDPEGTLVSVDTIVGAALHGTARKVSGTTISYTPQTGFTGHDFFVYRACDNGIPKLCNIATVDVFVNDCNSAPVVQNSLGNPTDTVHVTVYEDSFTTYCIRYVQADSPYVYVSSVGLSLDTVRPTAGSAVLGLSPCLYIAPPYQSRATDQVQVVICNAYPLCDTVTLIISVRQINHRPHAFPDQFTYRPGTTCINVIRNDVEDDINDHMTITAYDSLTANGGRVTQSGDSVLCYTPGSSFAGLDTFYYTVCDTSRICATTYVVVTVPVIARNDHATTMQDQAVQVDVLANDTRAAAEYITLCGAPLHGNAYIDSGLVVYTPEHNYPVDPVNGDTSIKEGIDSFCYTLCSVAGTDTACTNAYVIVTISAKSRLAIPQGISPNGDGINDKFVIPSVEELPKSQLLVFNRYGDEVWRNETDGYINDFDGTWKKNGQPLPDASYWYIFKFNDGVHPDRMGYIIIER